MYAPSQERSISTALPGTLDAARYCLARLERCHRQPRCPHDHCACGYVSDLHNSRCLALIQEANRAPFSSSRSARVPPASLLRSFRLPRAFPAFRERRRPPLHSISRVPGSLGRSLGFYLPNFPPLCLELTRIRAASSSYSARSDRDRKTARTMARRKEGR